MPLFEEKLISPFAVRFTQEHIRTTFRDGRVMEDTISEIEAAQAGTDDYDLVLDVPFPPIEIIRWRPPRTRASKVDSGVGREHEAPEQTHWFTLDNRRLYCLQRAAAAHWPRRVAAKVEILYADPGKIRRKYDSSTVGCWVSISPSVRVPAISWWHWRQEVPLHGAAASAVENVLADDGKHRVSDLHDLPGMPSMYTDLYLYDAAQGAGLVEPAEEQDGGAWCRTPSTSAASDGDSTTSPGAQQSLSPRSGVVDEKDESPPDSLAGDVSGQDTEVDSDNGQLPACGIAPAVRANSRDDLKQEAIAEVQRQLTAPNNKSYVWVTDWNQRYLKHLGALRSFLESQPDKFAVLPGSGRSYRVAAVQVTAPEETSPATKVQSRCQRKRAEESARKGRWIAKKVGH
mmetsp:Transcript_45357/g.117402  ORF Transcript_45357/g.117402 Transcript_45357/m.117402 type:complete len:401 (-) Transcript_45357:182-1384(-)